MFYANLQYWMLFRQPWLRLIQISIKALRGWGSRCPSYLISRRNSISWGGGKSSIQVKIDISEHRRCTPHKKGISRELKKKHRQSEASWMQYVPPFWKRNDAHHLRYKMKHNKNGYNTDTITYLFEHKCRLSRGRTGIHALHLSTILREN